MKRRADRQRQENGGGDCKKGPLSRGEQTEGQARPTHAASGESNQFSRIFFDCSDASTFGTRLWLGGLRLPVRLSLPRCWSPWPGWLHRCLLLFAACCLLPATCYLLLCRATRPAADCLEPGWRKREEAERAKPRRHCHLHTHPHRRGAPTAIPSHHITSCTAPTHRADGLVSPSHPPPSARFVRDRIHSVASTSSATSSTSRPTLAPCGRHPAPNRSAAIRHPAHLSSSTRTQTCSLFLPSTRAGRLASDDAEKPTAPAISISSSFC